MHLARGTVKPAVVPHLCALAFTCVQLVMLNTPRPGGSAVCGSVASNRSSFGNSVKHETILMRQKTSVQTITHQSRGQVSDAALTAEQHPARLKRRLHASVTAAPADREPEENRSERQPRGQRQHLKSTMDNNRCLGSRQACSGDQEPN